MKQKLILFAFTLISTMLFSQSQNMAFEEWNTTAGTQNFYFKPVVKTDGTDTYIAGATMNVNGNLDILVAKYNSGGHQVWIQQYAGSANSMDFAADMAISSTYVYITGAVTTNTTTLLTDAVTMKFNKSNGAIQWTSTYNGVAGGADAGKSIVIDATTSSILITGASYNSTPNTDILTIRYDATTGGQQWAKIYNGPPNKDDAGLAIRSNGTIINVGGASQQSTTTQYRGAYLTYAISNGSLTATSLGAVTSSSVESVQDFAIDASGNIFIAGFYTVSGQGYNFYVQKIVASTSSVTVAWTYTYNANNMDDMPQAMQLDASGNVYLAGYSTHSTLGRNTVVMKLNSSGVNQWTQTSSLSGDDEIKDMVLDVNNNIYVTGYKTNTPTQKDYYTIKYNNSGTKQWEIERDSRQQNDYATNIALDTLGNIIVLGQTELTHNVFEYTTVKYIQKDIIIPVDFYGEKTSEPFWYFQNKGQIRNINDSLMNDIQYYMDKTNPGVYVNNNSMRFVMSRGDTIAGTNDTIQTIKMVYNNVNSAAKVYPLEKQDYYISYFQGTNRDFAGICANSKIITSNLYPNIDLIYSSNQKGIKYYYIVKPGADVKNIQIEFTGATSYSINSTTNELSLNTLVGNIVFDKPIAYQLSATNNTIAVTSFTPNWMSNGAVNKFKFNTGTYTTSLTLVIEVDQGNSIVTPTALGNLAWNTYFGGSWDDSNVDLKLDKWGNIYTLAFTNSGNYNTSNTFQTIAPSINKEATILMKYNKNGKRLCQVYIGSNSDTGGAALTIVNDSNVVVVGRTAGSNLSGPFGGSNPVGAYTSSVGPSFIMKLDSNLTKIRWSTRYPGTIYDVDSKKNGHIYLCASSFTSVAHVKNEVGATNIPANAINSSQSAMVSKFNKNGVPLWSSYIGVYPLAAFYYNPMHIKIDTLSNEFYVFGKNNSGVTDWRGYNSLGTFYQSSLNSGQDCYIKKFDTNDSMIISTWYGGNKGDELSDAVMTKTGDVYFVGSTSSTDTSNIILNPNDGSYFSKIFDNTHSKGWIVKFDHNFNRKWSTLYGDSMKTTAFKAVTIDNIHEAIMLGGYTTGMQNMAFSGSYNKASDVLGDAAFLAFSSNNQLTWATSMGVNNLYEEGIYAVQFNPKDTNLVFAGCSDGNANYPWVQYPNSYWQNFNYAPGHNECNVGRFTAPLSMLVGIREFKSSSFLNSDVILYPNPTNSGFTNLYFKKGLMNHVTINVLDALGQIVLVKELNEIRDNTTININTTFLSEGIYFVNITSGNSVKTLKFITFK